MADPILLRVEVETDRATGEVRRATQQIEQSANRAGQSLKRMGDSAETTMHRTKGSFRQTKEHIEKGITNPIAGAGAAISAADNAMNVMGRNAPSQFATIASAAAAILGSGVGGLTWVLVGVTVAAREIAVAFKEDVDPAIKTTEDRVRQLNKELETMQRTREAIRTGGSEAGIPTEIDIDETRAQVNRLRADYQRLAFEREESQRRLDEMLATFRGEGAERDLFGRTITGAGLGLQAAMVAQKASAEQEALDALNRQLDVLGKQEAKLGNIVALERERANFDPAMGPPTPSSVFGLRHPTGISSTSLLEAMRGIRGGPGRDLPFAGLETNIDLLQARLAQSPLAGRTGFGGIGPGRFEAPPQPGFGDVTVHSAQTAIRAAEQEQLRAFQSIGTAAGNTMAGAISATLQDPTNYESGLMAMSRALTKAVTDAVAEGLIAGLGIREGLEGITGKIGSLFSGGGSEPSLAQQELDLRNSGSSAPTPAR